MKFNGKQQNVLNWPLSRYGTNRTLFLGTFMSDLHPVCRSHTSCPKLSDP